LHLFLPSRPRRQAEPAERKIKERSPLKSDSSYFKTYILHMFYHIFCLLFYS
jgi:hypothetical protein